MCRTDKCKAFTIVYSIIGIPLLIIVLRLLGKTMFFVVNWTWHKCKSIRRSKSRVTQSRGSLPPSQDSIALSDVEDQFPLSLAVFLCLAYLLIVTAVYSEVENQWDYFTTLYFIFITVSTIGLGDYVPKYPNYAIVLLAILVVGLSLVSMCISVTTSRFEKHYSDQMGCCRSLFSACFTHDDKHSTGARQSISQFRRKSIHILSGRGNSASSTAIQMQGTESNGSIFTVNVTSPESDQSKGGYQSPYGNPNYIDDDEPATNLSDRVEQANGIRFKRSDLHGKSKREAAMLREDTDSGISSTSDKTAETYA